MSVKIVRLLEALFLFLVQKRVCRVDILEQNLLFAHSSVWMHRGQTLLLKKLLHLYSRKKAGLKDSSPGIKMLLLFSLRGHLGRPDLLLLSCGGHGGHGGVKIVRLLEALFLFLVQKRVCRVDILEQYSLLILLCGCIVGKHFC